MLVGDLLVHAHRKLPVVERGAGRSRQRAQRDVHPGSAGAGGQRPPTHAVGRRRGSRGLRRGQVVQQGRHLRAGADRALQERLPRGSGHRADRCAGTQRPVGPALDGPEEERPILQDGAAEGPAKLVLDPERRFGPSGRLVGVTARVQLVVVVIPERRPVVFVGAALGNHLDHGTGRPAILGVKLVGDQAELLHDVRVVDYLLAARDARVVGVLPVNQEGVAPQAHAVDRVIGAGREGRVPGVDLADARGAKRQREDVSEAAAAAELTADGQIGDATLIEAHTDLRIGGVQDRSILGDRNRFGDGRRLQGRVHYGILVEQKYNGPAHVLAEASMLDRQLVGTHWEPRKPKPAVRSRL